MKKYIFIGICGFFGAVLRYLIKNSNILAYQGKFPLNVLFINVTGSFLLAFILTAALKKEKFDPDIKLGITTGFLGAYTTFSTLCKDTINLINNGYYNMAFLNLFLSIVLGLSAAYIGAVFLWKLLARTRKQTEELFADDKMENIRDEVE